MPEICPHLVVALQRLVWAGLLLEVAFPFSLQDMDLFGTYTRSTLLLLRTILRAARHVLGAKGS